MWGLTLFPTFTLNVGEYSMENVNPSNIIMNMNNVMFGKILY